MTGTTPRITNKNLQDEKLPHKLFLKTREKTKIRNAFVDTMSRDIKLKQA